MKVLVIGGTGTVGSATVNELLKQKVDVTVLSRKAKKELSLPDKVTHIKGNLLDPKTVTTMADGMDAVFLLNSVSPTENHEGLMAVNGIRMTGDAKIVYLSVHHVEKYPHLPHMGSKLSIEAAIKASGNPYTILRPNSFYQNDYWVKEAILEYNVYPHPIGDRGLSRVDVRDIAEAATIAITDRNTMNRTINIVGPQVLNGQQTAQIWSAVLGKEIYYGGNNLDAWEQQMENQMPDWMIFDLKLMYEAFQKDGFVAEGDDIQTLAQLLGHQPRSFDAFAKETANQWTSEKVVKK